MITDNDKKILLHLEKYKYATISQLQKIFYTKHRSGYNIVRRRMGEIYKHGYIKIHRDRDTRKVVYIWKEDKMKPPSTHRLIVLDVLAELYAIGTTVQTFEVEKFWMNGEVRSDALAVFTLEGVKSRYQYFVEVQLSNNDLNLEKYDKLFHTGEVQKYLGRNVFPRILLVTDRNYGNMKVKNTSVIKVDTRLLEFGVVTTNK